MPSLAPLETPLVMQPSEVPAAAPAPLRSGRYQSLDLWRGAACLMLVVYHSTFFVTTDLSLWDRSTWTLADWAVKIAGLLWIGVPLFFVVSGYCIAASVDSVNRNGGTLRTYFARRVHRIYPPLWIALAWAVGVTLLISVLAPTLYEACRPLPRWETWSLWNWLGNVTATESWQHHVTGSESHYLMNNTWTLCYEEQFYAVVGVFLLVAARRLVLASLLLCGAILALRHAARTLNVELTGVFFDGHWLLFAAGIVLHYQLTKASRLSWWSALGLFVAGMFYAAVDRKLMAGNGRESHFDEYLFVSCGFALALLALRRWDATLVNAWLLQPVAWVGKRSYSIYLTHFPVVVALACLLGMMGWSSPTEWLLVTLPLSLAASAALGWAYFQLVERRFLNAQPS